MSEEQKSGGYGYAEQEENKSSFGFGLNPGLTTLQKFEWTPNGGKDGAEMEALDIMFDVNGTTISYRQFPITKAFYKPSDGPQVEVTDPAHPAMVQEKSNLSAVLIHIIGCFVPKEDIRTALQTPMNSFKDFCKVLAGLLPKDFSVKPLDSFFQWEWQIKGDNEKTYLRLPKNMKHGRWIGAAIVAKGEWSKQQKQNASDNETALRYVDNDGNVHPFVRTGWFMNSNFATQQKEEEATAGSNIAQGSGSGGW